MQEKKQFHHFVPTFPWTAELLVFLFQDKMRNMTQKRPETLYLQECRHSIMVVASMKYPPQSTHIRWGFSSVILILVVRCISA